MGANVSGSKGSNSDYVDSEQGTHIMSEESKSSRDQGYTCGRGANRGSFCGRCQTDDMPPGGGHQMSVCTLGVNKKSDDGIESIYQNTIGSSLNSESKVKESVCYFLKSRLRVGYR